MQKSALIIGANGGIAQALIKKLSADSEFKHIDLVSRQALAESHNCHAHVFDSSDPERVEQFCMAQKDAGILYDYVICTTGLLHRQGSDGLSPEKRLEDINVAQLSEYFRVNSQIPAIWLRSLRHVLSKQHAATVVFFSARVGSISDNQIGGWYGYRASKAALNMLVKTAAVEYRRRFPLVSLACYHPGTVDTALSKPFQAKVPSNKLFSAEFTAQQLLDQIPQFEPEHSPYYVDWEGKSISW